MFIKTLFKNCHSVEEHDGWLLPIRFTKYQMDIYSLADNFAIRSLATSSVILSFKSAAKTISFEYRITEKARDWAVFFLHTTTATEAEEY